MSPSNTTEPNMTDIQKLRDAVVEAAKQYETPLGGLVDLLNLQKAVIALRAAEEAERKPRLMRADLFQMQGVQTPVWHHRPMREGGTIQDAREIALIEARDVEWLEAIRKLQTHQASVVHFHQLSPAIASGGLGYAPAVLLSDIEALAETGK